MVNMQENRKQDESKDLYFFWFFL